MNREQKRRLLNASIAHDSLLEFMRFNWNSSDPFLAGEHTVKIAARLDRAVADYREGKSTYLIIMVPFRHGKSEIISRHFPPFFFGHFPDAEVLLATYAQTLSNQMSRAARSILRSGTFQETFRCEHIAVSAESSAMDNWEIEGHKGKFQAVGIGGGATGKGADLLLVDDYLKGRSDAESELIRNGIWDDFAGNLFTRLAPVHIVVILATPWHTDDLIGRIKARMDPGHREFSPQFRKFELMKFSARKPDGSWLFPERFSAEWYEMQFAILGPYQSAALLQCEPAARGGNLLRTEKIRMIDSPAAFPKGLRWVRFWDLASTEKERAKSDPDYTSGALCAVRTENGVDTLYIRDVRYCQAEAPERNRLILQAAEIDGPSVAIGVESVAGYKDTYATLSRILCGRRIVHKIGVSKDKVVRAQELEPLFAAGNVVMMRGDWNLPVIEQLGLFPSGRHDDHVDSIAGAYQLAKQQSLPSRAILS